MVDKLTILLESEFVYNLLSIVCLFYLIYIMPKKCCVIGCNSGYDANKEKVNTFKFPTDESLKKAWLLAIGRKNYNPTKWSAVCHKHFKKEDILGNYVRVDPVTGAKTVFTTRVKLKDRAIPALNLNIEKEQTSNPTAPNLRGPGRPRKRRKLIESSLSSTSSNEDDIPLKPVKMHCFENRRGTLGKYTGETLQEKFDNLLDQYEELKNRHVALGQEIDILEKVNVDLKRRIFKNTCEK